MLSWKVSRVDQRAIARGLWVGSSCIHMRVSCDGFRRLREGSSGHLGVLRVLGVHLGVAAVLMPTWGPLGLFGAGFGAVWGFRNALKADTSYILKPRNFVMESMSLAFRSHFRSVLASLPRRIEAISSRPEAILGVLEGSVGVSGPS